jgi:hypothetical protein
MDPDVMITIVFATEVFLFALVPGIVLARRARRARHEVAAVRATEPRKASIPKR